MGRDSETDSSAEIGSRCSSVFDFSKGKGGIQLKGAVDGNTLFNKKLRLLQHTFFDYDHFSQQFYLKPHHPPLPPQKYQWFCYPCIYLSSTYLHLNQQPLPPFNYYNPYQIWVSSLLCCFFLFAKEPCFEDWPVLVSFHNGVEDVVGLSAFCLRDRVGGSFNWNEDYSWKYLLEAWVLVIGKPGIAE